MARPCTKDKLEKCVFDLESSNSRCEYLQNTSVGFTLESFADDDKAIHFYTGFPTYKRLMMLYDYLNPGEHGENIVQIITR